MDEWICGWCGDLSVCLCICLSGQIFKSTVLVHTFILYSKTICVTVTLAAVSLQTHPVQPNIVQNHRTSFQILVEIFRRYLIWQAEI